MINMQNVDIIRSKDRELSGQVTLIPVNLDVIVSKLGRFPGDE